MCQYGCEHACTETLVIIAQFEPEFRSEEHPPATWETAGVEVDM